MGRVIDEDDIKKVIDKYLNSDYCNGSDVAMDILSDIRGLSSAQPEQDILSWLLAYHAKSLELHGRYMPHEVIGWLVHDFSKGFIERKDE